MVRGNEEREIKEVRRNRGRSSVGNEGKIGESERRSRVIRTEWRESRLREERDSKGKKGRGSRRNDGGDIRRDEVREVRRGRTREVRANDGGGNKQPEVEEIRNVDE